MAVAEPGRMALLKLRHGFNHHMMPYFMPR
jgi:hypothetical protein